MHEPTRNNRFTDGFLAYFHSRLARLLLFFFSLFTAAAFANVVSFDDWLSRGNTAKTTTGNTVKIVRVESLDKATKTAGAVIDATDRFGNTRRRNALLRLSAQKFMQYGRACYRSPVKCGAAAAIAAGTVYAMGWAFDLQTDTFVAQDVSVAFPGTDLPACPDGWRVDVYQNFPSPSGEKSRSSYIRLHHVNCYFSQTSTTHIYRIPIGTNIDIRNMTAQQRNEMFEGLYASNAPDWLQFEASHTFNYQVDSVFWTADESLYYNVYEVYAQVAVNHAPNVYPDPLGDGKRAITPEEFLDAALSPEALQMSPGVFADVWESLDIDDGEEGEIVENPRPGLDVDFDFDIEYVGGEPELEELDELPEEEVDFLREFLDAGGSSWLPNECPGPIVINSNVPYVGTIVLDFSNLCVFLPKLRPFVILFGMIGWFLIVFRAASQ